MKVIYALLAAGFIVFGITANAQNYDPLHAPNSYRSVANPNYWKNKMPFKGYWQQDVHYTITANVDEQTDIVTGKESLVYWNNSPDTLDFVFFHLYQNAFQPGSYYDNLQKANNKQPVYGQYESAGKGTEVENLKVNGNAVKIELDNTIMKVWLPARLLPNESVTFDMDFKTYFDKGSTRRRMKKFTVDGNTHYDGVHWYPRISVYDRKFGWTTDQHLGREFYGDFGTFDVELTFAANYVVGATGYLQNREEMLPEDLRRKLDISNFAMKPWNQPASVITPYDPAVRKTWKYHAENVHDFAFTADPTYRIGQAEWNGITCYALAQEKHCVGWQNAADYCAKIIQTFSEDIGMYTYHKMIVADARDGMEYPMLTLDGGYDPNYRGLFTHEVGHNWFFGQVGNNETYRASLDEGFTQFLTAWGLTRIDGDTIVKMPQRSKYRQRFKDPELPWYNSVYYGYVSDALKYKDPSLNTHSDGFHGALRHGGGYGHVYYKTATMLYNLQYVLGDSLFLDAIQHYFAQWKIAHPYFEDFRQSIIDYTKVDLNWFFDQWLETSKRIDYKVKAIRKSEAENEYIVTFERKGRMQMPIDFTVTDKEGTQHNYHIPNTWFEKETEATILPRWIGWDKLQETYDAKVVIPAGIQLVEIDPSDRMADVNKVDNSSKLIIKHSFDHRVYNRPDWRRYEVFSRPDLWWNGYDGFKAGLHMNGSYMRYRHKWDMNVWFNTGLLPEDLETDGVNEFDQLSVRFNYSHPLDKFMKGSSTFLNATALDGLLAYRFGFNKKSQNERTTLYAYFKSMYRSEASDLTYLLFPDEWNANATNNTVNFGADHRYNYRGGRGEINVNLRSSSVASDYDYTAATLEVKNYNRNGKIHWRTRTFFQFGSGRNWAPESQLYLAGANPEELMDNKYTRSRGFFPEDWTGYGTGVNHFHYGGGLNLRGYSGYLAPHTIDGDGNLAFAYKGTSGAAFNTEIEFNRLVKFNPRFLRNTFAFRSYLFGDVGVINVDPYENGLSFADVRADAGVGTALIIQRWGPLDMVKPLTIRFDMPLVLNRIPAIEENYVDFRWVLGVSRAF